MCSASESFWFIGNGQISFHSNFQSHLRVSERLKAAMSMHGRSSAEKEEYELWMGIKGDKEGTSCVAIATYSLPLVGR